jgi:hypothetical protein
MRPTNDIYKLIKKLQLKASAKLDKRVYDDISKALAESEKHTLSEVEGAESVRSEPNILRSITRSGIAKLAVAAAILIAFGVGFSAGRWSKLPQSMPPSLNVTGYTSVVSVYPTAPNAKDSFWRQKALAAMKPKPYAQNQITKTNLIDAYKQYLREKHYD